MAVLETQAEERTVNVIHKCNRCKHVARKEWTVRTCTSIVRSPATGGTHMERKDYFVDERGGLYRNPMITCPGCNVVVSFGQTVVGRHSDRKCNARCMSSTTALCECSCSGANHGGKFA